MKWCPTGSRSLLWNHGGSAGDLAQAAAAGYLAHAAHSRGPQTTQLPQWRTSTLLGDFALDATWRQVGHRMTTIAWHS